MSQADPEILPPKLYSKPKQKVLFGNYCELHPLDKNKHAHALYEAFALDKKGVGWRYLPHGPFPTESAFLNWIDINCLKEDPLFYTICNGSELTPLGMLSLLQIDPAHGKIELGHIHFSLKLQKTIASTEAIFLLLKLIFEELAYRRLEWKCDNANERSKHSALRLGFTLEGVFRQHWIIKSRNRDTAWFSIIDKEWPEIKSRFERWLDPANFHENGHQIRKLSEL